MMGVAVHALGGTVGSLTSSAPMVDPAIYSVTSSIMPTPLSPRRRKMVTRSLYT